MFNNLRNAIYDKKFKLELERGSIHITNYEEILVLDFDKILLNTKEGLLKIKGNNLKVTKTYNDELQIEGEINEIKIG